jgi:hypothetical protein
VVHDGSSWLSLAPSLGNAAAEPSCLLNLWHRIYCWAATLRQYTLLAGFQSGEFDSIGISPPARGCPYTAKSSFVDVYYGSLESLFLDQILILGYCTWRFGES